MGNVTTTRPEVAESTPKYDARKNYKWEKEDTFTLKGEEFAVLINATKLQVSTGAIPPGTLMQVNQVLENLLVAGVESGIVVEMDDSQGPVQSTDVIEGIPLP